MVKEGYSLVDSLSIPSQIESLPIVETLIDDVCKKIGVHEEVYGNVLIAVTEAVNNAIVHGNQSSGNLSVDVGVYDESQSFLFEVKDKGNGFDHVNLPDPTAPENIEKENGRGIYLMRHLADEVVYNDKGNEVAIVFSKSW
jgi:serine/threonine-protein kinase RsbW